MLENYWIIDIINFLNPQSKPIKSTEENLKEIMDDEKLYNKKTSHQPVIIKNELNRIIEYACFTDDSNNLGLDTKFICVSIVKYTEWIINLLVKITVKVYNKEAQKIKTKRKVWAREIILQSESLENYENQVLAEFYQCASSKIYEVLMKRNENSIKDISWYFHKYQENLLNKNFIIKL